MPGRVSRPREALRRFGTSLISRIIGVLAIVLAVSISLTFLLETRLTRTELEHHARATLEDDLRTVRTVVVDEQAELLKSLRNTGQTIALVDLPASAASTELLGELSRVRRHLLLDAVALIDRRGIAAASIGIRLTPLAPGSVAEVTAPVPSRLLRTVDDRFIQAALVPLRIGDDDFLLVGGRLFDDAAAFRMRRIVGHDVLLVAGGELVGSTLNVDDEVGAVQDGSGPVLVPAGEGDLLLDYIPVVAAAGAWAPAGMIGVVLPDPVAALDTSLTRNRIVGALSLAALALALGWLLFVRLSRPLSQLAETARRVGDGHLDASFDVRSDDEIGQLSDTLETMRRSLEDQLSLIQAQAADLADSARRIVGARDAERRRLANDLHDGLQRRLVVLRMQLGALIEAQRHDPDRSEAARRIAEDVEDITEEVRALSHAIYPSILQDRGLEGAMRSLAGWSPVPIAVTFSPPSLPRFDPAVEANAYFLVSEAVTNSLKHAAASRLTVDVRADENSLVVTVADDGVGLDAAARSSPNGFVHMRDRATATGGRLEVAGHPDAGTRVTATFPRVHDPSEPAPRRWR